MNKEQAKDYIKKDLENYLKNKGIDTRHNFKCLKCGGGDKTPPMAYKDNKVKCFSCGFNGDIFDVIAIDYNLTDPTDIFKKAYELYNINDFTFKGNNKDSRIRDSQIKQDSNIQDSQDKELDSYLKKCKERVKDTNYFKDRGLSNRVIDKFNLGYDPNYTNATGGKSWEAVIIPRENNSYTARNTSPETEAKDRIRKYGTNQPYNQQALYNGNPTFVVEGEFDALSVEEVGGEAIALGSTSNINSFINILKNKTPSNTLILALDNDEAGHKATKELKERLEELDISFLEADISGQYKDPNEALINDRKGFINRVCEVFENVKNPEEAKKEKAKEEYLKQSTAHHINDFINGISQSVNTPYTPTGFKEFDKVLDGGLYEGLYIIGAISSLGKTTFILQIADQIAQQKQDVLIFSLEMARTELMAKSISRLTIELCEDSKNAKTTRGITTGSKYAKYSDKEKQLIKDSINKYSNYANHIFIIEGMGDIGALHIKEAVKNHISITGNKPIVIIDYLQLLTPYDMRSTDKQNTDKAVMELKRITRDYKIPIIGISSFNRQNYNQGVKMEAFKESGSLEYSSDVLLGLQLKGAGKDIDIDELKKKDPREVELKILKNRNGATGDIVEYGYYPLFNYFKEV